MRDLICTLVLFSVITACDPCPDCGEPISSEPTAEFVFVNQDSIAKIDDSLAVFAFNDSSLIANTDSLVVLNDSLQKVNDSIANGGSLDVEKMDLEAWILLRKSDSMHFATLNKDEDSLSSILSDTRSTLASGLLRVDQLLIDETGAVLTYTDSMTSWDFPLLFEGTSSTYELTIGPSDFSITLGYETYTEVDQQRNVRIRAQNIQITNTVGFDSLIQCETNCIDGNASFTLYF